MATVNEVMTELEKKGTAQTRKTLARHGVPVEMFGVKIGDLKIIAKNIKGDHALALALYETGNYDAMYLAGILADASQMSRRELEAWAKGATCGVIAEYAVAGVAAESPFGRALAMKWIDSKKELIACCGWCTYAGVVAVMKDEALDMAELRQLLARVESGIHSAPHRVRYCMNGFLISVATYVKPLLAEAKRVAKVIGPVEVDMGDTACKVPVALDYIKRVESMGRVGKKRKSARC